MALYAFDGTWCGEHEGTDGWRNSNVVRFMDYYGDPGSRQVSFMTQNGDVAYREGVGTRLGAFGKIVGGFTGAGGADPSP